MSNHIDNSHSLLKIFEVLMFISILVIYFCCCKNAETWSNFVLFLFWNQDKISQLPKCINPPNIIQFGLMEIHG